MRRLALAVALSLTSFTTIPASAEDARPPDATKVRAAAEQFDAGVSAFKLKDYESAASHFEAADAAVPGPKALRQAIRARTEAGQGARAATLAALALDRYPSDDATAKLANDTLEKYAPLVHKVSVTCASPCVLGVTTGGGTLSVLGEARTSWVIYLDPGAATLSASFADGGASAPKDLEAKAGAKVDLRFQPKRKAMPPPPPVDDHDSASPEEPSKNELPPEDVKVEAPPPERKGLSPGFFVAGLVATAGLGVTTIWSGIDTENNPGVANVMAACHGKGPTCPLYQEGLAHQTRTNALLGATIGVGAVTVVLAVFTRWRGAPKTPAVEPTALVVQGGAALGAAGVF